MRTPTSIAFGQAVQTTKHIVVLTALPFLATSAILPESNSLGGSSSGGFGMKAPFMIGRLLFGGFFLYNGINHFKQREGMAQYAKGKNVPMPDVAVMASGAALIVGGASLLLGVKPKIGAAAVAGFLAGVSPVMHDFWKQEDPQQRQMEMIQFSKNMALLGGALALMSVEEPWPASVPVAQPENYAWESRQGSRIAA
jgi:putative oxidoreductase